jgi:small-conductance mechanosensitive channel
MVDEEVEKVLREIRERVIAEERQLQSTKLSSHPSQFSENGTSPSAGLRETDTAESLSLISSYLTTTARAWNRLPPVVSNRTGTLGRLELWIKQQAKRATNWFTWEQVNFNAAVHHALRDSLQNLRRTEESLDKSREELRGEIRKLNELIQQHSEALNSERNERQVENERRVHEVAALRMQLDQAAAELRSAVAYAVAESRERSDNVKEEQRVCLKQIALETSETAIMEDRARRKADELIADLGRRLEKLEGKNKRE